VYYAEILRTEGVNAFQEIELEGLVEADLAGRDVVLLPETPVTPGQAAMLADWVVGGGNLIAFRPDPALADLLGLSGPAGTLSDGYLRVEAATPPGAGIVAETIQFHGTADLYSPAGASIIATLYATATTSTPYPAVSLRGVGGRGGQAAAFAYDLARSVVYTRQGNPAWAGQERDGFGPIRANDMFYGAAAGDPQPDWIDLGKVAIPQADEQQRLLVNLIQFMSADRKPLPRFWYFPNDLKAVVLMTGDDHGNGGTAGRFETYKASSPPGCSVAAWECVRSSSYIYPATPGMDDAAAAAYTAEGFEVGLHVDTGCADWTPSSLESFYATQLASWQANHPSLPSPSTERTHCIAWSDFATQPKVKLLHGIRLDTNYYYWPPAWVANRPGFFTGSGLPMRFADLGGSLLDVFQATTQMTDESGQSYPFTIDTLLDRALGPEGYYGLFTANMHTDSAASSGSDAIVASALARGVPVVSGRQVLQWLDGRNGSRFADLAWNDGALRFRLSVAGGADGLRAMVPALSAAGTVRAILRDGDPVPFTRQSIKGIDYAFFDARPGSYGVTYDQDRTAPVIGSVGVLPETGGSVLVTWTTDEAADSRVDFGTDPAALDLDASSAALVTLHSVRLAGLLPSTLYHYRVTSVDAAGNRATFPDPALAPLSFTTPAATLIDRTTADFAAGTRDGTELAERYDGEVILRPTEGSEFFGSLLPSGWASTLWTSSGTMEVSGGRLLLDGARAGTVGTYPAGRSLEFVATFATVANQHVGFGQTFNEVGWAIFSTASGSGLFARSSTSGSAVDTPLPPIAAGPHHFRIVWMPGTVAYEIDGTAVASHAITIGESLRPLASDLTAGDAALAVDFMRMSPFAAAGRFESRVLDAGGAAEWVGLSLTLGQPAGTSFEFETRSGDTPVPDATWSPFAPLGAGIESPSARYLQYRVTLGTADPAVTPALQDVTIQYATTCTASPEVCDGTDNDCDGQIDEDFDADSDGSTVCAGDCDDADPQRHPGAPELCNGLDDDCDGTADEGGDGLCDDANPCSLDACGGSDGCRHDPLADGTPCADGDACTGSATCQAGTCVSGAPLVCDDANVCTTDACDPALGCVHSAVTGQEEFTEPGIPDGWGGFTWSAGGSIGVNAGWLTVDGALARTDTYYAPGQPLDVVATFQAAPHQHIGFGGGGDTAPQTFNTAPWAIFSTGSDGTSLQARTWDGVSTTDQPIAGSWLGSAHAYRIEWTASGVQFFIDGSPVASHPVSITSPMRIAISDFTAGGAVLAVDRVGTEPICDDGDACTASDRCSDGTCTGVSLAPGEVGADLEFVDAIGLRWSLSASSESYNLYRGTVDGGVFTFDHACLQADLAVSTTTDPAEPALAIAFYYLVSGRNACGEGDLGTTSSGEPRPRPVPCP
jgi:hypothetical protein